MEERDEAARLVAQLDQAKAAIGGLAEFMGDYFDALLARGLERDEALTLVAGFQAMHLHFCQWQAKE